MKEWSAAAGTAAAGIREGIRLRLSKRVPEAFCVRGQGALSGKTDLKYTLRSRREGYIFNWENSRQKSRIFDLFAKLYTMIV